MQITFGIAGVYSTGGIIDGWTLQLVDKISNAYEHLSSLYIGKDLKFLG